MPKNSKAKIETRKTPSEWAAIDGFYNCSPLIGRIYDKDCKWPMYSYERPAYMLWNSIAGALYKRGWTDDEIKAWLQSKETRWALDGSLGEAIQEVGEKFAEHISDSLKSLAKCK